MFYENELQFLCDTFRKSHVRASVVSPADKVSSIIDSALDAMFADDIAEIPIQKFLGNLAPCTMYKSVGRFKLCYIYMLLPDAAKDSILFIGPYLSEPLSQRETLEMGEANGISPKNQRYLDEYYISIPVLSPENHLFIMLYTFCERMWDNPSFAIADVDLEKTLPASPINESARNDNFDDILVNMRVLENRYSFENEMMKAVSLGQIHKEDQLFPAFSEQFFEKRAADPLRNVKNYCIIMNTLLRKAAENGGVHPVYLDTISSGFAFRIEQLPSLSENYALMRDMFRSYCRLVRKHSMKDFSPLVQKTVLLIDSDLSANLSLNSLAVNQRVSPGYLSTIFKRETGKTVSEYIREKRVKHAAHLLTTTHLQVQTIALHCGIMDLQYFSKIFKKQTGKTPKEYRESMK